MRGGPTTRAPELYIDVMTDTYTGMEMQKRRSLYMQVGTEEVWIIDRDRRVCFFGRAKSTRCPCFRIPGACSNGEKMVMESGVTHP
jgi:hypothetical protein